MPRQARNGWARNILTVPSVSNSATNPHFDGTGALTIIDSLALGFHAVLEAVGFITTTVAGASAGSQVFKLRKGGASGTVIATLTLALASVNALGEVATIATTAAAAIGDKTLFDTDTFSLTRDASGTDYTTKPEGMFYIRYRQRLQMDA